MKLHLGCGTDYRQGWHNVDAVASVEPDQVVDLEQTPWPWETDSVKRIYGAHVIEHLSEPFEILQECKRVLHDGATCTIILPVGLNAVADPDHEHVWTWQTPGFYTGKRHWDRDCGLDLLDRDVTLWSTLPGALGTIHRQTIKARMSYYDAGNWCFSEPYTSGEFSVRFQA